MLGVMTAVIVLFLVGFFFPSLLHGLRVFHACVCVSLFFFFFLPMLLCNVGSDLGKNMCQRDVGRELSECVTTSTSVSSLTAQLATSLVTEQLSRGVRTLLIQPIQFHAYM